MANDLTWIDRADQFKAVAKEHKAFAMARDAFEQACRDKLNARAFSYRQGKISVGCEAKPVAKVNGKAIDPQAMKQLMALAKQLGISA